MYFIVFLRVSDLTCIKLLLTYVLAYLLTYLLRCHKYFALLADSFVRVLR